MPESNASRWLILGGTLLLLGTSAAACGDDVDDEDPQGTTPPASVPDAGSDIWRPEPDPAGTGGTGGSSGSGGQGGSTSPLECISIDDLLPESHLPRCSAATASCVEACPIDGDACRDACYAADTTPASDLGMDCGACVILRLLACFEMQGCAEPVRELACCMEQCFGGPDDSCVERECAAQLQAAIFCGLSSSISCLNLTGGYVGQCFADEALPEPDAGTTTDEPDAGTSEDPPGDAGA